MKRAPKFREKEELSISKREYKTTIEKPDERDGNDSSS